MIDEVKSTKLPNGIAVLTEHMPGLRSVTAGIWVRRGSRHETAELNGICHFIEHSVIEGTRETVPTFDHKTTVGFHAREFSYSNFVVAAAGNVDHARLVELVGVAFDGCESGAGVRPQAVTGGKPRPAAPILIEQKSELEQAHLVLATPWPSALSPERYAASLLGSIIGGGTSSRLWQKVREEHGLAYSVGAAGSAFFGSGVFSGDDGTWPA